MNYNFMLKKAHAKKSPDSRRIIFIKNLTLWIRDPYEMNEWFKI